MPNIIQIEELVYTRLPRISKSEWLNMLSKQGIANDYALLLDDYLLIEQTDYRFSNGNYISSERTVYNIDYTTYDTAENTPNPDNTEEIITVRYDSTHDRYYVYYTHFPIEDIPHTPDLSHILSEADIPSSHPFVQASPEKTTTAPRPIPQPAPTPTPQPKPAPAPAPKPQPVVAPEHPKKKKWKRLDELKRAYESGKTLKQIVDQFECTPEGAIYQLKNYLGIEHPFEKAPQQSAPKLQPQLNETDISVVKYTQEEVRKAIDELVDIMKPWPKAKLKRLKEMYLSGCTSKEMMQEFQCDRPRICAQLSIYVGAHKPFEEYNGDPWDFKAKDRLLYLFVLCHKDVQEVAEYMRRSEKSVNVQLYELIGREYKGMPIKTSHQRVQASIHQMDWKIKRKQIQAQIDNDLKEVTEKERRRVEDEKLKVNGFYRPGVQVKHPTWGFITVLKDDEDVLKFITLEGVKKTVRK